jgi:ABC-type branched-subunit amino acid transport system ATPase component
MALEFGTPIATGSPDEIQSDTRVIDAYLGAGT